MTYTELTDLIQQYLEEDEATFVANIPQFVKLAEERIYRAVQLQALQKNVTTSLTSSDPYLTLPTDFWSPLELSVTDSGAQYFLYPKDVSFIRAAYPSSATSTGRPRFYAMFDADRFILGPTPDSAYSVELHYICKLPSIVDEEETWLGTNGEQALLYASLVEAYKYLKGDKDLMDAYEATYQEALVRLKTMAEGQNRQDAYRNPEPSIGST